MIRVAIVGGGPGGLFTATLLEEKYTDEYRTTVFEACHRTGGKIVTAQFESAPVTYEAGVAELYNYAACGPDPLLRLVNRLGLKTVPMNSQTVILDGRILRDQKDVQRLCGKSTREAIRDFRSRCREAMPLDAWYEGSSHYDNGHPWAGRSCEAVLDEVSDPQARKYLKVAVHSDLAAEPHQTNGLNGLKNFLMDVPGYIRLYSLIGGIEQIPKMLRDRLTQTRIEVDSPVTRVEKNPDETYRVSYRQGAEVRAEDFDVVFVALPHNWLGSVEWGGEELRKAMTRFMAYYDRPGHYLRVSILFQEPFWKDRIAGSWFMLDAFGGCCVYDEGSRHDAGEYGVLSWLVAGTAALSMGGIGDEVLARMAMDSLPGTLRDEAQTMFVEAKVNRWPGAVSAQPGGLPVRDSRSAHLPEPREFPGLFMVGDYLFDSTVNGVLDSADFATDLVNSWMLRRQLTRATASVTRRPTPLPPKAQRVKELIKIAWKTDSPYRLLCTGVGQGLLRGDFTKLHINATGVDGIRKLPFRDNHFDFVYEDSLAGGSEKQLPHAIRELHRVCRRGVIFASATTDMNPDLFTSDRVGGMKSLMTLWEWGELFTAAGFSIAVNDDKTLEKLMRCEKKYNRDGQDWYTDEDSLRYCFYTKHPDTKQRIPGDK